MHSASYSCPHLRDFTFLPTANVSMQIKQFSSLVSPANQWRARIEAISAGVYPRLTEPAFSYISISCSYDMRSTSGLFGS